MPSLLQDASPRPWEVVIGPNPSRWISARSAEPNSIEVFATMGGLVEREEANARLAVEAVNAYETLRAALTEARELLERCWETIASRPQPDDEKAVEENRLLERVEEFLRETAE